MKVSVDAIGNLHGSYEGTTGSTRRLLIGSHLDTVRDAGAFDGVLGVVLGIGLVEMLGGERLPFAIEIIGFSEEEGVRFGIPFIGSRALVGRINRELLETCDKSGTSVEQAIRHFGLVPSEISAAQADHSAFAFLEFHIEQGPVLDRLNQPLGIVQAIAGQSRRFLIFSGNANHAGTTPMHLRRDALAGAAEWIGSVEKEAHSVPGLVATVGSLEVQPGTLNIIPGFVKGSLDVRHSSDEIRNRAVERLLQKAGEIATRRHLDFDSQNLLDQPAVEMDSALVEAAVRAASSAGCEAPRMTSGAGHDAMILAEKMPSVMFFLRSPDGISHHPDETVRPGDVEFALSAGIHFLHELASKL